MMQGIDELLRGARQVTAAGLSRGTAGNISVRVGGSMLVSASGSDMELLTESDVSRVQLSSGEAVGPTPSKEVPFHSAFYRRDAGTNAVVHVHSAAAMALSCLSPWASWSAVPPISPYFIMRVGQTPLIDYADPGDESQATAIEALRFPFRAVLLQNHGLIASGRNMNAAVDAAIELEAACDLALRVRHASPHLLDDAAIRRLTSKQGTDWFGPEHDTSEEGPVPI